MWRSVSRAFDPGWVKGRPVGPEDEGVLACNCWKSGLKALAIKEQGDVFETTARFSGRVPRRAIWFLQRPRTSFV